MQNIVRIGILGCANIAQRSVIPAILSLPDKFALVAIASRTVSKARQAAERFSCEAVEGYESLVDSTEVDALYIPLPTGLHREWINRALVAGKHVYAEKSIAMCSRDAIEMVSNAKARNLALMEGFMFQYHAQHRLVLDLIARGEIGEIRHFFSSFGFPPLGKDDFRYNEQLGGGALLDAAGYPLRAAHFILGDSFHVTGATLRRDPFKGTNIFGSAFLSNSTGVGASLAFGFDNFYQCRYEIWGAKGKIIAERAFTPGPDLSPKIIIDSVDGTNSISVIPDNHFVRAFEEFYSIIHDVDGQLRHYSDLLLQSHSLDQIRELGGV